jgi:hypothetical protein
MAFGEGLVIFIELRLQHSQTVELREQEASRFTDGAHGIVGMLLLPFGKISLRAYEIEIVKSGESMVEGGNLGNARHILSPG